MKEELYKYLSIGLLALLLLVCFGSLITYLVVGQESINIAYAAQNNGTYWNNIITNPDGSTWDFSASSSNSSTETVFYNDGSIKYSLYGFGSVSNNVFTGSGGNLTFRVTKVGSSVSMPSRNWWAVGYTVSSSGVVQYGYYIQNTYQSQSNLSISYSFVSSGSTTSFSYGINSAIFNFTVPDGVSLTINWLCVLPGTNVTSFPGFVPNSYSPNGYNQGYTDGVNSVSGGTVTGVNDLTNVSWEVPEVTTTASESHQYDVTGSVGDFNFDGLVMLDYGANLPIIDNDSSSFKPFYLIDYNPLTLTITPYYIKPGDIITFTGGEDVTNIDLIQWLEDNNTFKTYTEGYQDGYNSGYDIGYQDGYAIGNTDTIVQLDTTLQAFGSSIFTGLINQDPSTFWWSVQPGMQPNTAVYGYLYFNISSLPIGSIVHFNFPFQKYTLKDTNNNSTDFTDVRVLYDVDYYTNLLIAPRDSLPSIRFEQGTETYSFNVIRPGDTIILYFPLNLVTDFDRYTFGLTWSGDEYNYSFTTSSISQDIKTQLDNAYERGLKDGNSQGYTNGYTVGYNEGADGAEHYTFNNLLGAVFDAPITMFLGKYNPQTRMREGGLFNFELLGVNLTGFVIALLSIGVVLFIMRLFIRGL